MFTPKQFNEVENFSDCSTFSFCVYSYLDIEFDMRDILLKVKRMYDTECTAWNSKSFPICFQNRRKNSSLRTTIQL